MIGASGRHRLKVAVSEAKNRLLHRTDKDGESHVAGMTAAQVHTKAARYTSDETDKD